MIRGNLELQSEAGTEHALTSSARRDERRDLTLRTVREALAEQLGIHPRDLISLSGEAATAALANTRLLSERLEHLEETAAIDELTGVWRRGHGIDTLNREVGRAFRMPEPRLTLAFVDCDGLKWVNDHDGHADGDEMLVTLTECITTRLRSHDTVFRYGGDEFVSILPGANLAHATAVFDHIQKSFGQSKAGRRFSVGMAELRADDTAETLMARADEELYAERARRRSSGDHLIRI